MMGTRAPATPKHGEATRFDWSRKSADGYIGSGCRKDGLINNPAKGGTMKLKQISILIENSPGRLYEVTRALGDAGINLRALNLVDTGDFGKLRLLVSDIATTRQIVMQHHWPARIDEVVAVEIEDKPGYLAKMLEPLKDNGINVVHMYAYVGFSSGKAVMIFRFNDIDKAIGIIEDKGYKILDAEAFGILSQS